jgi:glutamate dehydrogenase
MLDKLDDAKAQLLEKAAEVGSHAHAGAASELDIRAFLRRFYRHVTVEDLSRRDPADVCGAALSHRQLARERPQGTANVRVFTPAVDEHGWSSGHTVVEVVTDDMPFLVDSVTAEVTRQEHAIHLVVHPQMVVRRDITGRLIEVLDVAADHAPDDAIVESWMHLEIDRESDPGKRAALCEGLASVLRDVREAIEDWTKMRERAERIAVELGEEPPDGVPEVEVAEAQELLGWLADDHFTFLGYREYDLVSEDGEDSLRPVPGTGLGILRSDQQLSASFGQLPPKVRAKAREKRVLILTKANSRATVHRPAYLDYVGVKRFDATGEVVGERRFLGLFSAAAYTESVQRVPVLRRKVRELLEQSGFSTTSHSGKQVLQILETYPRDELFQVTVDELTPVVLNVARLQERRRLKLFLRRDDYGRFMSCLVYLPRDRYTTEVRLRMEQILREAFGAETVDFTARVSESVLARLHFVVRVPQGATLPDLDPAELEVLLTEATRSWADDFNDALVVAVGEEKAARLARDYVEAFPEAYKEDFPARTAVADLRRVEALSADGPPVMSLYQPYGAGPGERRFKLFRRDPLSLSQALPILQRLGVDVVDERPYQLTPTAGHPAWIYDFGLRYEPSAEVSPEAVKGLFQEAFAAVWSGQAESDGFNALVLLAGLTWRQASVLRAYAKYLRQAGSTFSQDYVEQALCCNVGIARALVRLFEARFDPQFGGGAEMAEAIVEEIEGELESVASLDQDRILRSFLTLVRATLRTNYYQKGADGSPKPYLTFKFDPHAIPELPEPRPRFEVWVYSPRVEGVHLRYGAVARGGLRWSDRREDFRTEILGLVKAQVVKNAVIVPVGAKGGFVVKRPPADSSDRDAVQAEGKACYRAFISGLLDITDNLDHGEVVPPPDVVRHDGEDSYLVVAADKGTATFSDIANAVSKDYGFWLGDAFASGGSAGYDHKEMGITARGAWESVKRHFREMGVDTQAEDFTVIGIGDMSGDVFGNGMLLSEHIRLVAAFDHRHVFLDPDPDAATSYAERRRLFELPRSSWADYDESLLSPGGGIHPRTAKSIPITPQVRARLGIADGVTHLTPAEVMRAILTAPVDLFWNGGIGTYVKAGAQSSADVGDKANDAIRVNGGDLRVKVVGEGGNLGFTQLGRIEYALAGGRINTDAIDNSAGVDTSDHEVNIKILLDGVMADGDITEKQRNGLLEEMTGEVARLVLRDNYEQNLLLGVARAQAPGMLSVHKRFIRELETRGALNRALEFLPTDSAIDARAAAGRGLTSPEMAVLVAYSKITLTEDILHTNLPDATWCAGILRSYFPEQIVTRYAERLADHPLRREIVTTLAINQVVNRAGTTYVFRTREEVGAAPADVVRAFMVVRSIYDLGDYWDAIESLDNQLPTDAQNALYLEGRRLLDRTTRWVLQSRRTSIDVDREIERLGPGISALAPKVPDLVQGAEREALHRTADRFVELGAPNAIALRAAALLYGFSLLDVVQIAADVGRPVEEVAALYYALSDRYRIDAVLSRITALPRGDRWSALARSALRYDLYAALAGLTESVLTHSDGDSASAAEDPHRRIEAWERHNAEGLARARATLDEIFAGEVFDLATLSVALRVLRTLLRG